MKNLNKRIAVDYFRTARAVAKTQKPKPANLDLAFYLWDAPHGFPPSTILVRRGGAELRLVRPIIEGSCIITEYRICPRKAVWFVRRYRRLERSGRDPRPCVSALKCILLGE